MSRYVSNCSPALGGFICERRLTLIVFAVSVVAPAWAYSQTHPDCQPPTNLKSAAAQHPTAAVYDAVGAHFASQNRFACAIPAFEEAVRLDPVSWQGHYNLGIALLSSGGKAAPRPN